MANLFGKLSRNIANTTRLLLGIASEIDHQRLSHYIHDISRMSDVDAIVDQASKCLGDILNYKLFAFVMQRDEKLDIWVDPANYAKAMLAVIEKDFTLPIDVNVRYLSGNDHGGSTLAFPDENLMTYVLMDDRYYAKFYMLPGRRILEYHKSIMQIIISTMGVSLSNILNIEQLKSEASFDPLTNSYNRRELDRMIEHNIATAHRYERPLSVIMLDIDHFKRVNDTYGHPVGDRVLKEISGKVRSLVRKGDYVSRYGGEEFMVVLPDTDMNHALDLAERLRVSIEDQEIEVREGRSLKVTASFGVATLKKDWDKDALIQEADKMLYKAKSGGRNRVMPVARLKLVAPREEHGLLRVVHEQGTA